MYKWKYVFKPISWNFVKKQKEIDYLGAVQLKFLGTSSYNYLENPPTVNEGSGD